MFVLYTAEGKELSFYLKECAETYKQAYGGTVVHTNPVKFTFGGERWQQDFSLREQRLRQEMDEAELY